jgi:Mg2+/Co2+ transporter CorB
MNTDKVLLGLLIFLLILAAFFSLAETSMMSLNRYRLRHLVKHKHRGASRVQRLLERPDRLLGVILIGSTFANILVSAIVTMLIERRHGNEAMVIAATIILTLVVLIFCEMAPKTLAALHSLRIAFWVSLPLRVLLFLFYPVVWLANTIANGLVRLFGVNPKKVKLEHLSTEELRTILHEAGEHIAADHQEMLIRILDIEKITVNDIMVPRGEIIGLDISDNWSSVLETISHSQYTRLPVYTGSLDQIQGILHVRSLLPSLAQDKLTSEKLNKQLQPVYFIPENTPLLTQLTNFRQEKTRIGLVVDEYGDIQGLTTLEDILEEIIGEFTTATISAGKLIQAQSDGSYIIEGGITLREIKRLLGWDLHSKKSPKTLSGLIIEYLQALPLPGTSLMLADHPIEILQIKDNMVKTARIWPVKKNIA